MADHARDVTALMDFLGLDRVVLGGHSSGGYLAIYIAARHPERVEKLVVIDAAVPPGYPPLVDPLNAHATARAFRDARYRVVPGNHITMIFGKGAAVIRREIEGFVNGNASADEA